MQSLHHFSEGVALSHDHVGVTRENKDLSSFVFHGLLSAKAKAATSPGSGKCAAGWSVVLPPLPVSAGGSSAPGRPQLDVGSAFHQAVWGLVWR